MARRDSRLPETLSAVVGYVVVVGVLVVPLVVLIAYVVEAAGSQRTSPAGGVSGATDPLEQLRADGPPVGRDIANGRYHADDPPDALLADHPPDLVIASRSENSYWYRGDEASGIHAVAVIADDGRLRLAVVYGPPHGHDGFAALIPLPLVFREEREEITLFLDAALNLQAVLGGSAAVHDN